MSSCLTSSSSCYCRCCCCASRRPVCQARGSNLSYPPGGRRSPPVQFSSSVWFVFVRWARFVRSDRSHRTRSDDDTHDEVRWKTRSTLHVSAPFVLLGRAVRSHSARLRQRTSNGPSPAGRPNPLVGRSHQSGPANARESRCLQTRRPDANIVRRPQI